MPSPTWRQRKALRCELDALADIVVDASSVSFRHEIRTLRAPETFCETPRDVMARTESLLDADIADGVARTVHDTVTVAIGCNRVPLFALVEGGREHSSRSGVFTTDVPPSWTSARSSGSGA